ncbi:peptidase A4 family protein [Penicillium bovifimosum]|uniref:Peptidase A4 family protein n=1 Tax=Penicillium bovifimosum TaxID=126998 RepID=A0A9W9H0I2_9EURO|nr:peptidase A4 family protein [Penicillium bovifimosum]KAJ5135349.1 peptidase A4 family protein [Penicillium bovifimosum]
MKSILVFLLLTSLLHQGTTLGVVVSSSSNLQKRARQPLRAKHNRTSHPLQEIPHSSFSLSRLKLTSNTQSTYSSTNWAGAVLKTPPSPNATYTYVSATVTVPTPTPTSSTPTTYQAASAWVGIDGATYTTAILQTGVDFYIIDGEPYTDAWYEWYPNFALYYDEFAVNPGDVLVASVNMTAPDRGVCMIENVSTGETASKTVTAPKSTATIVGQNAEWVVEDFASGEDQVPFVGFGEVKFEGCEAVADGIGYQLEEATFYQLVDAGGSVIARVEAVDDESTVIVERVV